MKSAVCRACCCPVSPSLYSQSVLGCPVSVGELEAGDSDVDDDVREEDALSDEPIVGVEPKPKPDGVRALPFPKEMTPAQLAEHMIKHLPHCDGCPYCTAGRRQNSPHRSLPTTPREIPLMVADYGFLRSRDESLCTFLTVCVYPWRIVYALKCEIKGPDPRVTEKIAELLRDCGLSQFAYKNDRERRFEEDLFLTD